MIKKLSFLIAAGLLTSWAALGQEKPTFQVNAVKTAPAVSWPYDAKLLQVQLVAELENKHAKQFAVVAESPEKETKSFTLECEVLEWHSGNAAKRVLVGMGTGRESAKIRYAVTDPNGKKVFEHEDTIRAEFWGNAYAGSVGQLAHPLADKISKHLSDMKLD